MAPTQNAVSLRRITAQPVRVEPREAVAVLDRVWATMAGTRDREGRHIVLPELERFTLTAFGDLEADPSLAHAPRVAQTDAQLAAGLCKLLWKLMTTGRPDARGLPVDVIELLRDVEIQRRAGDEAPFPTPDDLLDAWSAHRVADGSAALAQLYARWQIAADGTAYQPSAWAGPTVIPTAAAKTTRRPVDPPLPAERPDAPRRLGGVLAAMAAVMVLLVLALGAMRGGRRAAPPAPELADSTRPPATVPAPVPPDPPVPVPRDPVGEPALSPEPAVSREPEDPVPHTPAASPSATAAPMAYAPTASAPRRVVRASDVAGAPPFSPSFVPTTGTIVFHAGRARTTLHEASLRADGSLDQVKTLLRDGASSYHVQVSPDGSQIAFDSDRDGQRGVYVSNRDGSHARRVSGEGTALVPSWSPDGARLAYVRAEPRRPHVWQIWIADLRTGARRQVTSHRVGQPWGGSWFPDGHRIAYSLEDRLVVLDTRTGHRRSFRSPMQGRLVRTPAVSPGGDRIAFQVQRDGMWMLDLGTGRTTRVLADRSAQEFAWSPDGRLLAYHSARAGSWEIWTLPVGP